MTRQEARAEINSRPELVLDQLRKSKGGQYICPYCNSGGHGGANSDGALTYYKDSNRFLCFACSEGEGFGRPGQDVLGALRIIWGCSESEIFANTGISIGSPRNAQNSPTDFERDNTPQQPKAPQKASQKASQTLAKTDYTEYYIKCRKNIQDPKATSYLQARGISIQTAEAYGIGFEPEWKSPTALRNGKNPPASPRLILPTSKSHYVARDIRPNQDKFAKMNEGNPEIFNLQALYNSENKEIFVTEGYFDALSFAEIGYTAIALNSTSNAGKLIEKLKEKRTTATLILCFDNDGAGQKCTKTLKEGLQRLNISFVTANVCSGYNDPNEALQKNRNQFEQACSEAQRLTAAKPDNVSDYIDTLMSGEIAQFREAKNRRTGFKNLDLKANGLYAGLYVVAAISSLGKTTFSHQIADQLAAMGEDVLFFSLEQSRLELVSKSIARRTAQKDIKTAVNSLSIRRGYLPESVLNAADEYKNSVSDRLSIIEGNFNCNISFIGDYIRQYIDKTGKKPVVFIDYLQILQPEKDEKGRTQTTKETVDTTVTELKRISREQGLTVFVISSVNRANYLTPIDFESLKESGGIEYTADVIWGLQLQVMNDPIFDTANKIKEKRRKIKEAKAESPRKIELVCLKNRYGISSYSAYFKYIPEYDLYIEGENEYKTDEETTEKPTKKTTKRL